MTTIPHYTDPADSCRLAFAPVMAALAPMTSMGALYRESTPSYSGNPKRLQGVIVTKAS